MRTPFRVLYLSRLAATCLPAAGAVVLFGMMFVSPGCERSPTSSAMPTPTPPKYREVQRPAPVIRTRLAVQAAEGAIAPTSKSNKPAAAKPREPRPIRKPTVRPTEFAGTGQSRLSRLWDILGNEDEASRKERERIYMSFIGKQEN